jgi:spore germination protein GerM
MSRKILIFLIILFFAVLGSIFYFQWENSQKESKIISGTRKVLLYYYNPEKDKDKNGNIKCSRDGLFPIERQIPVSQTPIKDTIELLLKGKENLTQKELAQGITTEFPLDGFKLKSINLKNDGTLILEFEDPLSKTVGGACRVGILWFQIEATAKQFPQVKEVKFLPEELFQP